jgi:hypothetical protein
MLEPKYKSLKIDFFGSIDFEKSYTVTKLNCPIWNQRKITDFFKIPILTYLKKSENVWPYLENCSLFFYK